MTLHELSGQGVLKSLYAFCAGWPLGGEIGVDVQTALLAVPPQLEGQQASQS